MQLELIQVAEDDTTQRPLLLSLAAVHAAVAAGRSLWIWTLRPYMLDLELNLRAHRKY